MIDLNNVYGDDLLMVFTSLKNENLQALAVVRDGVELKELENVLSMHYSEDFESQLTYKIPAKTRKPFKLLSLKRTMDVLESQIYGVIGCVVDDMPYAYGINYVVVDGHIYFHTGRKGYKLAAMGTKASFNVIEELGLAYNGTHNFRSVQVYGTLTPTEDYDIKKTVLTKLATEINPNHTPYVDSMQATTLVYEIELDYMMGRENLFLPGDGK